MTFCCSSRPSNSKSRRSLCKARQAGRRARAGQGRQGVTSGLKVQGAGLQGIRVQGAGCRVQCGARTGCRVQGTGCTVPHETDASKPPLTCALRCTHAHRYLPGIGRLADAAAAAAAGCSTGPPFAGHGTWGGGRNAVAVAQVLHSLDMGPGGGHGMQWQ